VIMKGNPMNEPVVVFLCGDVMTGRGIDQILPNPGNPIIYESYLKDARRYVDLAERAYGPIKKPVAYDYVWGDLLQVFKDMKPDAKVINLETAVTTNPEHWPWKGIQYRMNPDNIEVLQAAGIDCCVLANNHTLDWHYEGLIETLDSLKNADISTSGAGRNSDEANKPASIEIRNHRLLIFSYGFPDSGIPPKWAAKPQKPGINLLPDFSASSLERVKNDIESHKKAGDIVVCSLHWGDNWGYEISTQHRKFAHGLIDDAGVDLVHGHSSHHVKGIEIYAQKLILYGCGDFITDYEGIGGHESYRDDLGLMYFPTLNAANGHLIDLALIPTRLRNFRVGKARGADFQWLLNVLNRESEPLNARFIQGQELIRWSGD
jgi:poly-gamma-glutamate capsule biosynthesis protein CapA/YwtB (metallophosphatase superfamily)